MVQLNFKRMGEGPPLVILHGLYGSSDNWVSLAKFLSGSFEVFIPDLRNHGDSPHLSGHNYELLAGDIHDFLQQHSLPTAHLLGHSMGGKAAIYFALAHPEKILSLTVVDISPRSYSETGLPEPHRINHKTILEAMQKVDFSQVESRMDVDMVLGSTIKSQRIRQFLLKNVKRIDRHRLGWKINLEALYHSLPEIMGGLSADEINQQPGIRSFPVLFFKGEDSDYISEIDYPIIRQLFPSHQMVSIPNAGHWLHAEQPELFLKNLKYFLSV